MTDAASLWPNDSEKIAINPILFYPYAEQIINKMEADDRRNSAEQILKVFEYCLKRNTFNVENRFHDLQMLDIYQKYKRKRKTFDGLGCIADTLFLSAQKLCTCMELENPKKLLASLAGEMKSWPAAK